MKTFKITYRSFFSPVDEFSCTHSCEGVISAYKYAHAEMPENYYIASIRPL